MVDGLIQTYYWRSMKHGMAGSNGSFMCADRTLMQGDNFMNAAHERKRSVEVLK